MRVAALLCAVAVCLAGCAAGIAPTADTSPQASPAAGAGSAAPELSGTLTVFAAASLTETFGAFEATLEAQHADLDVVLVFAGSSSLAQQLVAGAPADVLASADETTMQIAVDAAVVDAPTAFAQNLLALAVPPGNPGQVAGLTDLARAELIVALCASEVPCGRAADLLLADHNITAAVDTREPNVRSVLTKIELGEVDAGLVYATDALTAVGRVTTVPISGAEVAATTASIAIVTDTSNRDAADAFLALVTSAEGARVLQSAGFSAAPR